MGKHPLNLALRFLLEIAALIVYAFWGWKQAEGWQGLLLAVALPVIFATIWGVFAVKDDPGRSGKTVVPTPGYIRIGIELIFFGLAALSFSDLAFKIPGTIFLILVVVHYFLSRDRMVWLLQH